MICEFPDRYLKLGPEGSGYADVERLIRDVTRDDSDVKITSIKGGITNQLLMAEQGPRRMLVRAFGKGTSSFIDRTREFAVHRQLTSLKLAPELYCRFGNGLIYGFVEGRAVLYPELSHPDIICSVSSRLAQWHALLKIEDVTKLLSPQPLGNLWSLLEDWIKQCPSGVLEMSKTEMVNELEWFKNKYKHPIGEGEVMGHCDLLASNILVPKSWDSSSKICTIDKNDPSKSIASFIDYEYAMPCPRFFDIANHFQEWQGYDCDRSLVPNPLTDDKRLIEWIDHYIKAFKYFTGKDIGTVDYIVSELAIWWGMPGFYWGIWSAIQSTTSEIDFDYANYARTRFEEYHIWKKTIYPYLR